MKHGREKSDLVIVAVKPANKAKEAHCGGERSGVGGAKGGGQGQYAQQSTYWTLSQARVSQALERIRQAFAVTHPEVGAVCGKAARTDLGEGRAMKRTSLPLQRRDFITLLGR